MPSWLDAAMGRMHIVCYLRRGSKVFETYWTTARGSEVMDNNYHLLDLTVYGRQEKWEDSPAGWPQHCTITRTKSGSPTWQPEWPGGRPNRPVAPRSGRIFGRPGNGRTLNRAAHASSSCLKAAAKTAANLPWSGCSRRITIRAPDRSLGDVFLISGKGLEAVAR
jgi:hypothetical protein